MSSKTPEIGFNHVTVIPPSLQDDEEDETEDDTEHEAANTQSD